MRLRTCVATGITAGALVGVVDACAALLGADARGPEMLAAPFLAAAWMLLPGAAVGVARWVFERVALRRAGTTTHGAPDAATRDDGAWFVAIGVAVVLLLVPGAFGAARYVAFATQLQDDAFTARLSMFAWALTLAALALAAVPLARGLHALLRWRALTRVGSAPRAALVLLHAGGIALALACIAFGRTDADALGPALAAPYACAMALVTALLSVDPGQRLLLRVERTHGFWWGAALILLASAPLASASPSMQRAVEASPGASRLADLFAYATDVDRDGQSSLFGGLDCAPFDARRGPFAVDVPGNAIDEDCDGHDARRTRAGAAGVAASTPLPPRWVKPYNIVLVIVDALRADRLGRGRRGSLTPSLDALARESTVFEQAFSQAPSTRISFPSFLSGRLPSELVWKRRNGFLQPDARPAMLAERLRRVGYRTGLVVNRWIRMRLNDLFRGYDTVLNNRLIDNTAISPAMSGPSSNARAVEFIERNSTGRAGKRPFFLTLYYDGPHSPYDNHKAAGIPARSKRPVDRYDSEIRYADRELGHFLDYLRVKPKLWPNTVVIVLADHGEEFGEHGGGFHDRTCYRESTHVPLIIRVPGVRGAVAPSRVALTNVVPTVLALVGAPADPSLPGRNLLSADPARYAHTPDERVSCTYFPDQRPTSGLLQAVRDDRWLVVRHVARGHSEVYDTLRDPREKHDLHDSPEGLAVARRLSDALRPPRIEEGTEVTPAASAAPGPAAPAPGTSASPSPR